MATVSTPLKRARSMATLAGLDPDTMSAADYLERFGVMVDLPACEVQESPADEWDVTPEEQAEFREVATSGERHEWLEQAATFLRPVIEAAGGEVPRIVRVSISWPWGSRKAIGQCWHADASRDNVREVFISPTLDDSIEVLATLAHEMCHACLPPDAKHGKDFARLAHGIGLEGRMTATVAGDEFKQAVAPFVAQRGAYPAKGLDAAGLGRKKQTTRMLKCECSKCGYIARVSGMWIERAGPPVCPVDQIPMLLA